MLVYVLLWIFLSVIVGILGNRRSIGFIGAFLISLIISPIIGFIITLMFENKEEKEYKHDVLKTQKEQKKALDKLLENNNKEIKREYNEEKVLNEKSKKILDSLKKHRTKIDYLNSDSSLNVLTSKEIEEKKEIINGEIKKLEEELDEVSITNDLESEMIDLKNLLNLEIINEEEYAKRKNELIQNKKKSNTYTVVDTSKVDSFKYGGTLEKKRIEFEDGVKAEVFTNTIRNTQVSFISKNSNNVESMVYYENFESCIKAVRIYKETGNVNKKGFIKSK